MNRKTEKKVISEATLELLLESSEEREGCSPVGTGPGLIAPGRHLRKRLQKSFLLKNQSRRIEKARSWIKNSAAVYLFQTLSK